METGLIMFMLKILAIPLGALIWTLLIIYAVRKDLFYTLLGKKWEKWYLFDGWQIEEKVMPVDKNGFTVDKSRIRTDSVRETDGGTATTGFLYRGKPARFGDVGGGLPYEVRITEPEIDETDRKKIMQAGISWPITAQAVKNFVVDDTVTKFFKGGRIQNLIIGMGVIIILCVFAFGIISVLNYQSIHGMESNIDSVSKGMAQLMKATSQGGAAGGNTSQLAPPQVERLTK